MSRAVVDQPGLKFTLIGLVAALFFGLIIRSQITKNKIETIVRTAFQSIEEKNKNKKLSINFSDAELLLSDWGFPFPRLIIKNIKVSSSAEECFDNQVYIENLEIPFSWFHLIEGRTHIESARVSLVELRINNINQCLQEKTNENLSGSQNENRKNEADLKEKKQNEIRNEKQQSEDLVFFAEKIKIIDKHNYNIPIVLQAMNAKLNILNGKIKNVDLKSQVYLFKDLESGIYKIKSDLGLKYYSEIQNNSQAEAILKGKIIDKPFEVSFNYKPRLNSLEIKHKMTDLSLKAIMSLLNGSDNQFDGISGISISNSGEGEFKTDINQLSFYKIDNIRVSSDDNNITVNTLNIKSLKPLRFDPFNIVLDKFNLEKFKNITAFSAIKKSLNDFGTVSGVIFVKDSEPWLSSEGKINNLEFIFSNRGKRAFQKIDEISYKFDSDNINLNKIKIESQPVGGEINISFFKKIAQARLSNLILNENVYDIFFFNKKQNSKINIDFNYQNELFTGSLKVDRLISEYAELNQAEVNYSSNINSKTGKTTKPNFELNIKNLKLIKSDSSSETINFVLDSLETNSKKETDSRDSKKAEILTTDYNFEMVKAKLVKGAGDFTVFELNANRNLNEKSEKNSINMRSEFANTNNILIITNVKNNGHVLNTFKIKADLSQNKFNVE